jgi:nucleoside transporter
MTYVKVRLCLMMFLNYFVWGTWYGNMNTYLTKTLQMSATEAGSIFGTVALACIITPFFVGLITDRFLSTEKTLSLAHVLSAVTLFMASRITDFGGLYTTILIHCLCFMPTIALTNTLTMRQVADPGREFPFVRMFGTFGWIASGWTISGLNAEPLALQFQVGGFAAAAMAIYALTLPKTPPQATQSTSLKSALGLDALSMLKNPSFGVLALCALLACIPLTFYFSFTNPFLTDLKVANSAGIMTLGQAAEVGMMLIMPFVFRKVSVKGILLMGLAAWAARYALFAMGDSGSNMWMIYLAILLHGVCYDFFFMTAQLYTDQEAPRHLRGSAQGLIQFITYGLGMYLGSELSGRTLDIFSRTEGAAVIRDWQPFWFSASAGAAALLLLIALFFRSNRKIEAQSA